MTYVFTENIGQLSLDDKKLLGDNGIAIAKSLLDKLGNGKLDNEKEREYEERMTADAFGVLEIDLDDS